MPPRFNDSFIAALKQTLLPRAPACLYTAEDVAALQQQTGLDAAQILKWASDFRYRVTEEQRVKHLSVVETSEKSDKVISSPIKLKRCYVYAFNVDKAFASNFKLPKARTNGKEIFMIKYMHAAFDYETSSGEFFIIFDEMVYDNKIVQAFEEAGAGSVVLQTFDANDDNTSASAALLRVWETAARTGIQHVNGSCCMRLHQLTKAMWSVLHPTSIPSHHQTAITIGSKQAAPVPETEEFDVVKKRRRMEEALQAGGDDAPDALARFEDFEHTVMGALTAIHADDQENKGNELLQMEEEPGSILGGVYVARCEALAGIVKIGATRRADPTRRLWEISRYVPKPFQLVEWIPTPKPFSLEAKIHKTFAAKRLKERGAGTEFFELKEADIQLMLESVKV